MSYGKLVNNVRNWDYEKIDATYDNTTGSIEIHISKVYMVKNVSNDIETKVRSIIASQNWTLVQQNDTSWRKIIQHESGLYLMVNRRNGSTVLSLQEKGE